MKKKSKKSDLSVEIKAHCHKHPQYKALRKPRADCDACRIMFDEAEYMLSMARFNEEVEVTLINAIKAL